jgi:hypothetical protein
MVSRQQFTCIKLINIITVRNRIFIEGKKVYKAKDYKGRNKQSIRIKW